MTGRELIIYILSNNLEDKPVIENGKLVGFVSDVDAAVTIGRGVATIHAYINTGKVKGYPLGSSYYIPKRVHIRKDETLK